MPAPVHGNVQTDKFDGRKFITVKVTSKGRKAYLRKLLDNPAVLRYLSKHFSEILAEFQKILETATLEGSV